MMTAKNFLEAVKNGPPEMVANALQEDPTLAGCKDKRLHHRPALSIAIERGHLDIVEWLLIAGGDANQRDAIGKSPMEIAVVAGNEKVVKRLAEVSVWETQTRERLEWTIGVARRLGHKEIQEFLESFRSRFPSI